MSTFVLEGDDASEYDRPRSDGAGTVSDVNAGLLIALISDVGKKKDRPPF